MFAIFRKRTKKEEKALEKVIEQIKEILFPEQELVKVPSSDGVDFYQIDRSTDSNLDNVLQDISEGICGKETQKALNKMIIRIEKLRPILGVQYKIDERVSRIIIDCDDPEKEIFIGEEKSY